MNRLVFLFFFAGVIMAQTNPVDTTKLPEQQPPDTVSTLPEGKPFFPAEDKYQQLQIQIDSLKQLIRAYQRQEPMPNIDDHLLSLVPSVQAKQRITLQNGTVVSGVILQETDDQIILATQIGRLVLNREFVVKIDENKPLQAQLKLVQEPNIDLYPDREVISGTVKNEGEISASFVRVVANLWTETTDLVAADSSFVDGSKTTFPSGVISDTSVEPGKTAKFVVTVPVENPDDVQYRTFDIHWEPGPEQ